MRGGEAAKGDQGGQQEIGGKVIEDIRGDLCGRGEGEEDARTLLCGFWILRCDNGYWIAGSIDGILLQCSGGHDHQLCKADPYGAAGRAAIIILITAADHGIGGEEPGAGAGVDRVVLCGPGYPVYAA